ncbi:type IX secretion system membrane protein PorP/SprF [Aggregatimonas sangjinii]|uniref:Type IX secretion system membrane protein PorP/SprF n=1 Tax=Aggregatimonas sangjinii TaxID=2583587 RepID=A0A5B7SYK8_9FLAO|nr:type IX secretion system membrane protein PorP/SprF [Aggregatimonas sangjinii]QCX01874.1 type IX secretion system membrane protein PorP/SprF [Aggregatimonas sangjinii]
MRKTYYLFFIFILGTVFGHAQQDPQYTQYQYNPITVNPGYAGSRGHLTLLSLYRSQWVGLEGSPKTITFGIETPIGLFDGVGLSIIQDELGPATETYFDANYAHQLILNRNGDKLALGIKAGARVFSLDFSKGIRRDADDVRFNENVNGKLLPSIGAGVFYFSSKAYLGLSVPNFFPSEHYDEAIQAEADERMHFNLIGGYVFDINPILKFKPSFFVKQVVGSPVSVDVSTNFLLYETLNLGVNYRWDDSVAAILGFQISPKFNFGYAYDYSINNLNGFNSGSHEIFLRYQLVSRENRLKSPRFF